MRRLIPLGTGTDGESNVSGRQIISQGRNAELSSTMRAHEAGEFLPPTAQEPEPCVTLDLNPLGHVSFVHDVVMRLGPRVHRAAPRRIRISMFNYNKLELKSAFQAEAEEDDDGVVCFHELHDSCRYLRLELLSIASEGTLASLHLRALRVRGEHCWKETLNSTLEAAFMFYGPKPLFGRRTAAAMAEFEWTTYAEVWGRVLAFERGLGAQLQAIPPELGVAVMGSG